MLWANINMSGEWISPLNRSTAQPLNRSTTQPLILIVPLVTSNNNFVGNYLIESKLKWKINFVVRSITFKVMSGLTSFLYQFISGTLATCAWYSLFQIPVGRGGVSEITRLYWDMGWQTFLVIHAQRLSHLYLPFPILHTAVISAKYFKIVQKLSL